MLQEHPPEGVLRLLEHLPPNGQPLLFATSTDLTFDGRLEPQWLVLTPNRLVVLAEDPTPRVLLTLPIAGVESFRAHAVVGSGLLQARVDDVWVDVVRYSNSLAQRFRKVAAKLEKFQQD